MPQTGLATATAPAEQSTENEKCCCCQAHESQMAKLEAENHLLKEKLAQIEMMHAISAAKTHGSRTVLTALEEERQYL